MLLINMWRQYSKRPLGAPLLPTSAFNTSGDPSPRSEIAARIQIFSLLKFLPWLMAPSAVAGFSWECYAVDGRARARTNKVGILTPGTIWKCL